MNTNPLKVLWICQLPGSLAQEFVPPSHQGFFSHPIPWIPSHLPPPEGIDLHIACHLPGGKAPIEFNYLGATWHLIPVPKQGRSLSFFAFDHLFYQRLFRHLQPDLVHAWGTEDSHAMIGLKLRPRRTLVGIQGIMRDYIKVSGKGGGLRRWVTVQTERWALSRAQWVVGESQYSINQVKNLCPQAGRWVVQQPLRPAVLGALPCDIRAKRAIFVGNISPRKGIAEAIRSFARGTPGEWMLDVAGFGAPDYVAEMKGLAQTLGVGSRVQFLGNLDAEHLIQAMQRASIFLLPTKMDTGPTSLKEAICLGLWPVCFDNSGPGEYIRHFGWGGLAEDSSLPHLQTVLEEGLGVLGPSLEDWQHAVSAKAKTYFSAGATWRELGKIYERVSLGRGGSEVL